MSRLACDDVEALLPLVADGTLDEAGDPALFLHLADCERCQQSLVSHDLIALSLTRMVQTPAPQVLRPRWPRFLPAAAAAVLLIGGGSWALATQATVTSPSAPPSEQKVAAKIPSPAPAVVPARVGAAPGAVVARSQATPAAVEVPVAVEVEVVALPGSTSAHPHYLVRRGEQVLLIAPAGIQPEAPSDARPASYSPNRY